MEFMKGLNNQEQFVKLLAKLTDAGQAKWTQTENDPGYVYCLVRNELIKFEVRGNETADYIRPSEDVAGIYTEYRNTCYLWLEGLWGWDSLLSLLRDAPIDDEAYKYFLQVTENAVVQVLESFLKDLQ